MRRKLETLAELYADSAEPSDAPWRQMMLDHPNHATELMPLLPPDSSEPLF